MRRGGVTSNPVVSLSNHGDADVAVLRRAQDDGGGCGGGDAASNPVVSLSNHGARLSAANDEPLNT